jgi:hypothetical protein
MGELIRAGAEHPVVRYYAEQAVAGVHPRDLVGQAAAVRDWIGARVEYRRDPLLAEWLQTPWYVLRCQIERGKVPQLDCDDLTDLSLSMLGSIGFPADLRVVSTRPDQRYNHVYGLVSIGPERWALDLTRTWARPGSQPARETRGRTIPVLPPRALPFWRRWAA